MKEKWFNMAVMTAAQKTMVQEFEQKYFALLKKYWNPEDSDEYWDGLTDDAMNIIDQFQSSDIVLNSFLSNIVAAFLNSREEMIV